MARLSASLTRLFTYFAYGLVYFLLELVMSLCFLTVLFTAHLNRIFMQLELFSLVIYELG